MVKQWERSLQLCGGTVGSWTLPHHEGQIGELLRELTFGPCGQRSWAHGYAVGMLVWYCFSCLNVFAVGNLDPVFRFLSACICFLSLILRVQNLEPLPCNRNLDLVLIHGSDGRPCPYIWIVSSCHLDRALRREIYLTLLPPLWSAMFINTDNTDFSLRLFRAGTPGTTGGLI
jgi:hypothetical protein